MRKGKRTIKRENVGPIKTARLSERLVAQVERRRVQLANKGFRGGVVSWSDALRDMIRQASQKPKGPRPAA